ncbi:MAG: hypothetical protein QOE31_3971 [Solirubrobacteraceae bacterium]|jgi:hypothetical protein|nr:hypothetical protein [Solirubrobacteraceae bacterium]
MARLARTAFLATLLIAVAALSACGGNDQDTDRYIRELTAAQETYKTTAERIEADATTTSSPRQDRRTLDRFAAAIAATIAALRRIDVPPKVVAEHRRFVAVYVTWHGDIVRFIAAIRKPTRRGVARAQRRIAVANLAFNSSVRMAATDIDAKLAQN